MTDPQIRQEKQFATDNINQTILPKGTNSVKSPKMLLQIFPHFSGKYSNNQQYLCIFLKFQVNITFIFMMLIHVNITSLTQFCLGEITI